MTYDNVRILWMWASWESRNAWIWIWDPFHEYGSDLGKWFRLKDDNPDSIQNMLVVAAMARVNMLSVNVTTDGPVGNDPIHSASKVDYISTYQV